jgi:hypothetical protein
MIKELSELPADNKKLPESYKNFIPCGITISEKAYEAGIKSIIRDSEEDYEDCEV